MQDPRKPRPLKPGALSVLVMDTNNFTRGLIGEILRSLDVTNIAVAHDESEMTHILADRRVDLIMLSWELTDAFDAMAYIRALRRRPEQRLRRLPVVLITSTLTHQLIATARDAGVDEFLAKPISPVAMRQRLGMVIETPRPFVDCAVYMGPCRRRKNPADYYGAKRRSGDNPDNAASPMVDADEEAAKTPMRVALSNLRAACTNLSGGRPASPAAVATTIQDAKRLAAGDDALAASLASFEKYMAATAPRGVTDATVVATALGALEQLAALPPAYKDMREHVASALNKAMQKKLAA